MAGLSCDRILNEPSAAALAYRIESGRDDEQYMMVIDFGGGTLDVSLVDCFENIVEIAGVSGNNRLGGKNFDALIAETFLAENHLDREELSDVDLALIKREAENSKIALSGQEQVRMSCKIGETVYAMVLDDEVLIKSCGKLLYQMKEVMVRVIKDAGCQISDITDVILTGGTCKNRIVRNFISELFHRDLVCGRDAQVLVAKGIGYYVGIKQREEGIGEIVMTDVCPFSLGTGVIRDNDPSLIMNVLIKRNSKLPKSVTERYFPVSASQDRVEFDIYQGEHYHAEDNQKLGEFEIRIPQGVPMAQKEIKVTMAYDINGILYVQAENAEGRKVDYIVDG